MFSYFIFNGVHSRDMGVYLAGPAPVMRGKKRVIQQTVLGRPGALIIPESEDAYEPYTQQLILRAREPVNGISKWLRGEHYITFSGEPDRKQLATVINQTQFKKVSKHLSYWEGTVQFLCQPLKEAIHEESYLITSGDTITNLGDTDEKPLLTLEGAYGDFAISAGGRVLAVTGLGQSYGGCVIDCDAQLMLSYDKTELLTNLTAGDFPVLKEGDNTVLITGSHPGAVTIGRRQRWL